MIIHLIAQNDRLFSLANANITTNDELLKYLVQYYLPSGTTAQIAAIAANYPDDITQGSPFDTGILNALTPEYKRIAAIQGDLVRIGFSQKLVFFVHRRFVWFQRYSKVLGGSSCRMWHQNRRHGHSVSLGPTIGTS